MEVGMKNIHMCRQIGQKESQVILDEDLNVPDVNPDVESIIQYRETVALEPLRVEKDHLYLNGSLKVSILYLDDTEERRLHRLEALLPFEESFLLKGIAPGDTVNVRYETEDVSVTLINSRKLSIRAVLNIRAIGNEMYDLSAAASVQSPTEVCTKKKKLELMQLEVHKKDIVRLRDEVSISSGKPDIQEIIWDDVQLRNCRIVLKEDSFDISGQLLIFILYESEGRQNTQWLEQLHPFHETVKCSGCKGEMIPDIDVTMSQMEISVKQDADGENRMLHLEGVLNLDISIFGVEETEIMEDVFSVSKKLNLSITEDVYESLVMKNESSCKVVGKIRIPGARPGILQICHGNGSVRIDKTEMVEEGIQVEGVLIVSILYVTSDDKMPLALLEGSIPFSHTARVPGIDPDCRFRLRAGIEQLHSSMTDSEEIEIRCGVLLDFFIARSQQQQCIHKIEEEMYSLDFLETIPGVTGYFVQEGESLWGIAKRFLQTPGQIIEQNGLESEELQQGQCLVLMKNVSCES